MECVKAGGVMWAVTLAAPEGVLRSGHAYPPSRIWGRPQQPFAPLATDFWFAVVSPAIVQDRTTLLEISFVSNHLVGGQSSKPPPPLASTPPFLRCPVCPLLGSRRHRRRRGALHVKDSPEFTVTGEWRSHGAGNQGFLYIRKARIIFSSMFCI